MINLIIKIEELNTNSLGNILATHFDVSFEELNAKPTKKEQEVLKIIKDRIGTDQKLQIIDKLHCI